MSQRLKPDVAAPGVDVSPRCRTGWSSSPGRAWPRLTSPEPRRCSCSAMGIWTPGQVKSALVQSGTDAAAGNDRAAAPTFQGGGVVSLTKADRLSSSPTFRDLTRPALAPSDEEGRDRPERCGRRSRHGPRGGKASCPPASASAQRDGRGARRARVRRDRVAGREAGGRVGYVVLRREGAERRIPYWGRVTVPALARHEPLELRRQGTHRGTTARRPALVTRYRYPDDPGGLGVTTFLRGPETVYRVRLTRAAKNFGVVITSQPPGNRVEPRVVTGLDENRLTGYAGLPVHHNPYLDGFQRPLLAAGALSLAGEYAVVFDSATLPTPGASPFASGSTTSPRRRCGYATGVRRGDPLRVAATDTGSGIYRQSIRAAVDGGSTSAAFAGAGSFAFHRRPGAWQASTSTACLRLSGDEEHRERGAHPPEHAHADDHFHDPRALMESETQRPRSGRLPSRAIEIRASGFRSCALLGLSVALLDGGARRGRAARS